METPDPPSDTPKRASKKVFLTPHDIPRILRVEYKNAGFQQPNQLGASRCRISASWGLLEIGLFVEILAKG